MVSPAEGALVLCVLRGTPQTIGGKTFRQSTFTSDGCRHAPFKTIFLQQNRGSNYFGIDDDTAVGPTTWVPHHPVQKPRKSQQFTPPPKTQKRDHRTWEQEIHTLLGVCTLTLYPVAEKPSLESVQRGSVFLRLMRYMGGMWC